MRALACPSTSPILLRGAHALRSTPWRDHHLLLLLFLPTNTKWSQTGSIAFYVEEDDSKAAPRKKDCRKGFPEHWVFRSAPLLPTSVFCRTRTEQRPATGTTRHKRGINTHTLPSRDDGTLWEKNAKHTMLGAAKAFPPPTLSLSLWHCLFFCSVIFLLA